MDRPKDAQIPPSKGGFPAQVPLTKEPGSSPSTSPPLTPRIYYLIAYNALSTAFWAVTLGRVIGITSKEGHEHVYAEIGQWVKWTQTVAVLEIAHSLLGLVRAPLLTTAMQVASRLFLVWAIVDFFPALVAPNPAYASMLLAWSATEVVRYSYFVITLAQGYVEGFLFWARYNLFFVLYPLGIASECWLVYSCLGAARGLNELFGWVLVAVLLIYIPGSYVLFTHMMAQRRKVFVGAAKNNPKKTN